MRPRDIALAALTSVIWGLAFVATKIGLESFSAPQLTALRFLIACLPVLFLRRPQIAWSSLILIGLTLFSGQFLLLFFAYENGMPAGLASVTQQTQAFLTVILAALFLRDLPSPRQCAGLVVAFAGLFFIGSGTRRYAGSQRTWLVASLFFGAERGSTRSGRGLTSSAIRSPRHFSQIP